MTSSRLVRWSGACLLLLCAQPAPLPAQSTATVTSTQLQSNFNGATGAGQTAPIAAQPFSYPSLAGFISIQSVSITFTVVDGDTGLGPNGIDETPYPPPGDSTTFGDDDFDVNSWTLTLNGINLGPNLLLNGFNSYDNSAPLAASDYVTVTITGSPDHADALLSALQTGSLTALVYDSTGVAGSNGFVIPNTTFDRVTPLSATLSITGVVPEPAPIAMVALGCGLFYCAAQFRQRRRGRDDWDGLNPA